MLQWRKWIVLCEIQMKKNRVDSDCEWREWWSGQGEMKSWESNIDWGKRLRKPNSEISKRFPANSRRVFAMNWLWLSNLLPLVLVSSVAALSGSFTDVTAVLMSSETPSQPELSSYRKHFESLKVTAFLAVSFGNASGSEMTHITLVHKRLTHNVFTAVQKFRI